ncbi:MAG UNVERIFIED_CONTAM: hypothetical protein LVR29_32840 [Microcystis novacekii LVE1205-3]
MFLVRGAVGVRGDGETWHGVAGVSKSTTGGAGVFGVNDTGAGVRGESSAKFNPAVHGIHKGEERILAYKEKRTMALVQLERAKLGMVFTERLEAERAAQGYGENTIRRWQWCGW